MSHSRFAGKDINVKRSGFTLIEIMIVVGIIAIMLVGAVMSVASGRSSMQVKEATRGVIQLSRYASALALLRQRPVVVTFHKNGRVEVRISSESIGTAEVGSPSDPIYLEVNGEVTKTAAEMAAESSEENEDNEEGLNSKGGESGKSGENAKDEDKGLFYTRQVLDPDELAKEDAEGEYKGIVLTVEVLDEQGNVLPPELAAARSLKQPERTKPGIEVFNSLDINREEEEPENPDEAPVSVTYETNGSVNPHRIIIRTADSSDSSELEDCLVINVSRSGKTTVGDEEQEERSSRNAKQRRR